MSIIELILVGHFLLYIDICDWKGSSGPSADVTERASRGVYNKAESGVRKKLHCNCRLGRCPVVVSNRRRFAGGPVVTGSTGGTDAVGVAPVGREPRRRLVACHGGAA